MVRHCQLPVIVGVLVCPFNEKAVLLHLHALTDGFFRFHQNRETVQLTNRLVFTARLGVLSYLLQACTDAFDIGRRQTVQPYRITVVTVLIGLYP